MRATHICFFRATRISAPEPEKPFLAKRIIRGEDGVPRMTEVLVTLGPTKVPRIRCDGAGKNGRGQCREWSVGGAMYAWGAAAYCAFHLDEECGPVEPPAVAPWWESRRPT